MTKMVRNFACLNVFACKWLMAGLAAVCMAFQNAWSVGSQAQVTTLPFQVKVIDQSQWTPDKSPPPGIVWVGNNITIVAPMVFGTPCHSPNVEVRSRPDRSSNTTVITVELLAPRWQLKADQGCMAVLWSVYVIVTIPDLPPGKYSVDVRNSLYSVNIKLPNPGGRLSPEKEILPWP